MPPSGSDLSSWSYANTHTCSVQATLTPGSIASVSVSASGTSNGANYSNSAAATAGAKVIKLYATNTATQQTQFASAYANGGWNETFTFGNGSGNGLFFPKLDVSGLLTTTGAGASETFVLDAFLNGSSIRTGTVGTNTAISQFDALNPKVSSGPAYTYAASTATESVQWTISNAGPSDPDTVTSLPINQTVTFAIPFTYGTPFTLGIYAVALAGERAASGDGTVNQGSVDLSHTITWDPTGWVQDFDASGVLNPTHITNYTLTAKSGSDYSTAVPEPASMLPVALALLWPVRRRRRL